MIVSASYRTDIPAFYGDWFRRRLAEGYARVRNPYGGAEYRVGLRPGEAEGFVFWTRNIAPFLPALDEVAALKLPFLASFTVTGYPRALEAGTIAAGAAAAQIRALANRFGSRMAVWRYDPIVLSSLTPPDWHARNLARLARALRGATDECVASFVSPYRKTARNLDAAARRHGFSWRDPEAEEKRALVARLAGIVAGEGMRLTLCTQPEIADAAPASRCIDAARLGDIAGRAIAAPTRGNRPGCRCARARDIGGYDTCAQGCVYCYAVSSRETAQTSLKRHDPRRDALPALRE
jgi:hypothetical protein